MMKSPSGEMFYDHPPYGEALTGSAEITVSAAACRLPTGIASLTQLSTYLLRGQTAVIDVPEDRWGREICDPTGSRPGTTVSHSGSFLDNVTDFDAKFFGISATEAAAIDPQQRIILEVAWEAMRTVRPRRDQWAGSRTAVYAGLLSSDYRTLHAGGPGMASIDAHYATGTEASFAAGRLAHLFDLRGPALSVATACSSSLVAVTLAADALRGGHIDAAVVCGVNLLLAPELSVYMSRIGALSPSGACRPFAPEADGIIRGEGCAVVILERTHDVLRTGRRPLATIRCYGTNHDGYSAGLTAPNADAQVALLSDVLSRGGLRPDDLDYVEAHGTGTPLGDLVELAALTEAIGRHRTGEPLLVGSHKANFGHLDAAAGLVGLVKALGVVRSGSVPPQPHLADDVLPGPGLRVPAKLVNVAPTTGPIRAGVSAFGLSGTNAHIVLESFDPPEQAPGGLSASPDVTAHDPGLILISAHSADALTETVKAWTATSAFPPDGTDGASSGIPWADNPHAARTSLFADHRAHRIAAVGPKGDRSQLLQDHLQVHVSNGSDSSHCNSILSATITNERNLVLLLPGEISAWDRDALATVLLAPAAQDAIDRCVHALPGIPERNLRDVLVLDNEERNTRPRKAYLAAFTAQYAISCRLHDDGLRPATTVGEGLGRLTAAVLTGHLGLREALRLLLAHAEHVATSRGRGRTVVVHAPKAWLQTHLPAHDDLRVVSDRGIGGQVVCGPDHALRKLESRCRAAGIPISLVDPDHALHPLEPCVPSDVLDSRDDLGHRLPAILHNDDTAAFLEVGGSGELARIVRTLLERDGWDNPVHTLGTIMPIDDLIDGSTDGRSDDYARTVATLWVNGVDIGAVPPEEAFVPAPELIPPPTWERRCYWSTSLTASPVDTPGSTGVHPNGSSQPSAEAETATAPPSDMPTTGHPAAEAAPDIAELVNEEIHRALDIPATDAVPGDQGLFERGLDSLGAVEVGRRLAERLGVSLPATFLYEHPTLHALVEALDTTTLASTPQPRSPSRSPVRQAPGALAIVGMAFRLPGASTDAQLWDLLSSGASTTRELPAQRPGNSTWAQCGPEVPRRAAWLDGIDQFDHRFFRMSPAEACAVDPQQRLLLEVAWEALEDAGIPLDAARRNHAGVYAGFDSGDYAQLCARDPGAVGPHFGTGTSPAAAAGRLSYTLGLTGPAVAIDTACSSSLAALHAAGAALREEDCNLAFVGAANLVITPTISAAMGRAGALAADGRCKPFSAGADGYGRGDGVVCLLVKTLQRALADNDRIHAVVEATAVNQNGASGGFTVPAQAAQERLIRQALSRAGRTPGEIVAVEAHGTGTRLGDPIELRALANVFSGARNRPVALGAVKASLGHLEAAAGLAGLVKLILCYRHGAFPQQPLPDGPTPHFEWNESPLESSLGFPLQPADIVGLSSFGFSGTNAHAIVSGPHPAKVNGFEPAAWIVPISAHTPEATRQRVRDLADAATTLRVEEMAAVVSTLTTGRTHLPHRTYVTAQTSSSLLAALRGIGTGAVPMPTVHDVSHLGSDPDSGALASGELTGDDLGQRFIAGLPVDWMAVARGRAVHPLPRYPWQHTSHWISPPAGNEAPTASEAPPSRRHDVSPPAPASPDTAPDTLLATIAAVAGNLGMAVDDVDPDVGFFDLGMDSVQAVAICGALGGQFGIDLEATVTFEHPNCRQLALHITDLTGRACATHPSEPTIPAPRAPLEEGRPEASETEPSLSLTSDGTSDGVTDALAELDLALNRTDALLIKGAEA